MFIIDVLKYLNDDEKLLVQGRFLNNCTIAELSRFFHLSKSAMHLRLSRLQAKIQALFILNNAFDTIQSELFFVCTENQIKLLESLIKGFSREQIALNFFITQQALMQRYVRLRSKLLRFSNCQQFVKYFDILFWTRPKKSLHYT